jgi:peptidoglycan hydrolase-like protein with peptidoglycan-binding domain
MRNQPAGATRWPRPRSLRGLAILVLAGASAVLAGCGGAPSASAPSLAPPSTALPNASEIAPVPAAATAESPATTAASPNSGNRAPSRPETSPPTTKPAQSPPTTPPAPKLSLGDSGPAVLALQQRLSALGYWLGTPDGTFGDSTQQAVFALQKAAGISRDGVVGPNTVAALDRRARPAPRSSSGYVIEVDLASDLVMFVQNGRLEDVLNTSTGGGYTYSDGNETAIAITPVGLFHIYRQVDGTVTDSLGQLWRPKFFEGGFALHGDSYVPSYPASHGCVRVSNEAIDWIWAENLAPFGTTVWVY